MVGRYGANGTGVRCQMAPDTTLDTTRRQEFTMEDKLPTNDPKHSRAESVATFFFHPSVKATAKTLLIRS
jgi:hypothetical protein